MKKKRIFEHKHQLQKCSQSRKQRNENLKETNKRKLRVRTKFCKIQERK